MVYDPKQEINYITPIERRDEIDSLKFNELKQEVDISDIGFGTPATMLLTGFMNKVGITPINRERYLDNLYNFATVVRHIESDNDPTALASALHGKGADASGVYQFKQATIGPARRSVINAARAYGVNIDSLQSVLDITSKTNPTIWTDDQADLMFIGHLMSKKGSQWYLDQIGKGNRQAAIEAYEEFHHTDPDSLTRERTLMMFDKYWKNK